MIKFDFPARFFCAGFLVLALIALYANAQYNLASRLGTPCKTDTDCGQNTVCWRYTVSPACEYGSCECKAKFYRYSRDPVNCYPRYLLPLNSTCYNGELEQYPRGAHCQRGIVECKEQYELSYDTCVLLRTVQSDYGTHCISDTQCNPEIGLFCNLAWQACTCYKNYIWQGNGCEEAYYGISCETDDNCQTGGAYALGGPGNGGTCDALDHTCVCDRGFMAVNFTAFYLDNTGETTDMIKYSWTICVVNEMNVIKLGVGDNCTVPEWSSATYPIGQRYCKAGLACIVCPEAQFQLGNNASALVGTCRNGGRTALRSDFAAAAILTAVYLVAYLAKLLTVILGLI